MSYCRCSVFDYLNPEGQVHELQCVRDYGGSPCFVVLLSQEKIDDDKTHKWELRVRGLFWRLCHPLWRRRHRNCTLTECFVDGFEDKRKKQLRDLVKHFVEHMILRDEAVSIMEELIDINRRVNEGENND